MPAMLMSTFGQMTHRSRAIRARWFVGHLPTQTLARLPPVLADGEAHDRDRALSTREIYQTPLLTLLLARMMTTLTPILSP